MTFSLLVFLVAGRPRRHLATLPPTGGSTVPSVTAGPVCTHTFNKTNKMITSEVNQYNEKHRITS